MLWDKPIWTFVSTVTTTAELVIWTVMSNVNEDILEVQVDDYILKVFGLSEFLNKWVSY